MDFAVGDPRLKIYYFIPHPVQNLEQASPFGWYTPGLHASSEMLLSAATCPADVREPFTKPENVLQLRLRRLLWRNVVPVQIPTLQSLAQSGVGSLFRVVLTNDPEVARVVDNLQFSDEVPFLHVSAVAGQGRLPFNKFNLDSLLAFIDSVLTHLSGIAEWHPLVAETKDAMPAADLQKPIPLGLGKSYHNVTAPNELALTSYGWLLGDDDPLVPIAVSAELNDPQQYIDRICLTADTVSSERQKLMKNLPVELMDCTYIISVPSIFWGHYRDRQVRGEELTANDRKAFRVAYKNAVQQSTYFDSINDGDGSRILENEFFQSVLQSRAADQRCYTSGLTLLSSATLTPVLRLEPKINQVRGALRILAHCVRSNARIHLQFKQSRLARVAGQLMRDLVDEKFLVRIDQAATESNIQGLKVVSDVPLEWLPCLGVPLGLRYDLSRIPLLPGNQFLSHCVAPPVRIGMEALFDILVIRSFAIGDHLKPLLEQAIDDVLDESVKARARIRFVDVQTIDELIDALSKFSGAILIFDGHGSYEDHFGVGTFVVGGNSVDVWSLREKCSFPPIVIFSACDTHPLDGGHGSCANAAFVLGAKTVLATLLPISGRLAAVFIGRLIFRIFEFVPMALKIREILTWREVISGMVRMSYTTEVTRLLVKYAKLPIAEASRGRIQLAANIAINNRSGDWYETYLENLAHETNMGVEDLHNLIMRWASLTDALKYVQLGSPENVIITTNSIRT